MIHKLFRVRFSDARSERIWLTVYADLITNLALVFLALYGLTLMGDEALAKALNSMRLEDTALPERLDATLEFGELTPVLKDAFADQADVTIHESAAAVRIEFGESVLFESGRATLRPAAAPILKEAVKILERAPYTVVVEGHTDPVPLRPGTAYRDNWELSLARAMSVADLLMTSGLPAGQIAAAAYGEHRPQASNLTRAGRRLNRRVNLTVFRDFRYGAPSPQAVAPVNLLEGLI